MDERHLEGPALKLAPPPPPPGGFPHSWQSSAQAPHTGTLATLHPSSVHSEQKAFQEIQQLHRCQMKAIISNIQPHGPLSAARSESQGQAWEAQHIKGMLKGSVYILSCHAQRPIVYLKPAGLYTSAQSLQTINWGGTLKNSLPSFLTMQYKDPVCYILFVLPRAC